VVEIQFRALWQFAESRTGFEFFHSDTTFQESDGTTSRRTVESESENYAMSQKILEKKFGDEPTSPAAFTLLLF